MARIYFYLMVSVFLYGKIYAEDISLPEGAYMPNYRRFDLGLNIENPFAHEVDPFTLVHEITDESMLTRFLKKQIKGFIHSEEDRNCCVVLENLGPKKMGESIKIKNVPGVEGDEVNILLKALTKSYVVAGIGDREVHVPLKGREEGVLLEHEKLLTRGVIVHEDGWIMAPMGNLKEGDQPIAYLNGMSFPVQLVHLYKEAQIAVLKLYRKNIDLPFVPIAKNMPDVGDSLLVQEFINQSPPYAKQILKPMGSANLAAPEIHQDFGTVKLNEKGEIVSLNVEKLIDSEELKGFLGPIRESETKSRGSLGSAFISIIES